jgi:hypothetical protein
MVWRQKVLSATSTATSIRASSSGKRRRTISPGVGRCGRKRAAHIKTGRFYPCRSIVPPSSMPFIRHSSLRTLSQSTLAVMISCGICLAITWNNEQRYGRTGMKNLQDDDCSSSFDYMIAGTYRSDQAAS